MIVKQKMKMAILLMISQMQNIKFYAQKET